MVADAFELQALGLLRALTGDPADEFRSDQLDVIRRLVAGRQRVLLVQRTGWGKSAVYFIATRMLRDRGDGPTLLVSPLLALMRNQTDAAARMGVSAHSINSSNRREWDAVTARLEADDVDVLLISPERLANDRFRSEVLPLIGRRSGLIVVDEAHCISDWGHDFRPDYRRIARVLELLPAGAPVLCCTATANDRVVSDVIAQLGDGFAAVRGPLSRDGLRLHGIELPAPAGRMAWLADVIPRLPGTGIVYCLTVRDVVRLAGWLRSQQIDAVAYTGETDDDGRLAIERSLLDNDVKVVVATTALGMGFDKPDIAFVIHYQSPGSPIAYYQQVGRAGRALTSSVGVLLCGAEDAEIQDYFIESAFPPADATGRVVALLESTHASMSPAEILAEVNVRRGQLDTMLKLLEIDGAIERDGNLWLRTLRPWSFDQQRVVSVTALRRTEQRQMVEYARATSCRMATLGQFLDDRQAERCGRCDVCTEAPLDVRLDPSRITAAIRWLRSAALTIQPRLRLPDRSAIAPDLRLEPGRCLSSWGDGGWGQLVREGKQVDGRFADELVEAAAELIREWSPSPAPSWIAFVPSLRDHRLVADFAVRLAASLGLPCEDVVVKVRDTPAQKTMQNSAQQFANVTDSFALRESIPPGPVLLVDDVVDSRWTLTAVGAVLLQAGCAAVIPFALADSAGRSS